MLERLFLYIVNMSLTSSVVILFILAARLVLRRQPKVYCYVLWSVVLFRLSVPWSFDSILSFFRFRSESTVFFNSNPSGISSYALTDPTVLFDSTATQSFTVNSNTSLLLSGAAFIWLIGFSVFFFYHLVRLNRLKRKLSTASLLDGTIYESESISVPFILGLLRPKIYLPSFLSEKERELVILHEEHHIKRFDPIIKWISFVVLCVHWFNPLVWIAFSLSTKDMEISCDEAVVRKMDLSSKKAYASTLLALSSDKSISFKGAALSFAQSDVKQRIQHVLRYKKRSIIAVGACLIVVLFLIVGLALNPLSTSTSAPQTDQLYGNRTAYVGDNSAVGAILSGLDFPEGVTVNQFSLSTSEEPYEVTVLLDGITSRDFFEVNPAVNSYLEENAILLFSLIENVEIVSFDHGNNSEVTTIFSRSWAESELNQSLWEASETEESFQALLEQIDENYVED